jgi:RNA polymerase sigma-70 factor (ECF subfamily)
MDPRKGDARSGFEQLVREHGGRIRSIARRFAANGAVDDLEQDILMRLWRSYPGFRGDSKIESWVYRVALNAAMTHVSQTVKARAARAAISAQSALSPEGGAGTTSTAQILSDFLGRLGEIDASILMMYMDGLTSGEMSGVLGITENAINVRISRIKLRFSEAYID